MRLPNPVIAVPFCLAILLLCGCGSGRIVPEASGITTLAQAQSQLHSLAVPTGANSADFEALREAMLNQLSASGKTRWVSAAPADGANKITDLSLSKVDDINATASWSYTNVGDYDQNSEVNISDLTPLGSNLGKNSASASWASAQLADGDGNNEVNISDITPLGAHLQNSVDGYLVQSTLTPLDESSWQPVASIPFAQSTQDSAGAKRKFSTNVVAVSGQSFRIVPFFGTANGIPGAVVPYTGQTGGGNELPFTERQPILDLIAAKMDNLTATTSAGQDSEIAAYIATLPHIEEAGSFEGNAWGRFDDETTCVVCKNHAPAAGQQVSSLRDAFSAGHPGQPTRSASGFGLPVDNGGDLLWGYGPGTYYTDPTTQLGGLLSDAGYDSYAGACDAATLHSITNDGFLYVDAPAAQSKAKDKSVLYWIGMDQGCDGITDSELAGEIHLKNIAYMFAKSGSGAGRWQYCFGSGFVKDYMSFSANSIVFLNCPLSGNATKMLDEFHFAGASVVLGWTANVPNDVSYAGALQLVDRLCGANEFGRTEDPPIRAFDLNTTVFDLQQRGVSSAQPILYPLAPTSPYQNLQTFYTPYNPFDGFSLFVPAISHVVVDVAQNQVDNALEVNGNFGDTADVVPSVFINNEPLEIIQQESGWLLCKLPPSGAGSYGDVEVMIGGHYSNPRQLTEWRGTLTYTEVGPGTLKHEVIYTLHFRADLNDWRLLPDTDPLYKGSFGDGAVSFFAAPDSSASINTSGFYHDSGDNVTTWTDGVSTSIANVYGASTGEYMDLKGQLDLNTGKLTFSIPTGATYHVHEVDKDNAVILDQDTPFFTEVGPSVDPGDGNVLMTLGADFSLGGGHMEQTVSETTYSADWELMQPSYAPDPNTPR